MPIRKETVWGLGVLAIIVLSILGSKWAILAHLTVTRNCNERCFSSKTAQFLAIR